MNTELHRPKKINAELLTTLTEELAALKIWSKDQSIPSDVYKGMQISIDKIRRTIDWVSSAPWNPNL